MALIALKSQYVSLVVTLILAISELALLFGALRWNCVYENKMLERHGTINVRKHRTRIRLLTAATTSIFIVIEVFNSIYSDPTIINTSEARDCTFLTASGRQDTFTNISSLSSIIVVECMDANRTTIEQRAGNLFRDGDDYVVQCTQRLYSFSTEEPREERIPSSGAFTSCLDIPDNLIAETQGETEVCVVMFRNETTVSFTELLLGSWVQGVLSGRQPARVWHTDVYFNASGLETALSQRAVAMLAASQPNRISLRREVFTVDGVGRCEFEREKDGTVVSDGFVYALAAAVALSLLVWASRVCWASRVRYDMSNVRHWARNTLVPPRPPGGRDAVVCSRHCADGRQFVVLWRKGDL